MSPMFLEALTVLLILAVLLLAGMLWHAIRQAPVEADRRYVAWREQELVALRAQLAETARREALVEFEKWKLESTAALRQEAIVKSQSVTLGKVSEHLAPFLPEFQWNPKDARFLGSPIDFLVFDGLDDGIVQEVIFVEVKTAGSAMSVRQRQVRDAVQAGRVAWVEMRIG